MIEKKNGTSLVAQGKRGRRYVAQFINFTLIKSLRMFGLCVPFVFSADTDRNRSTVFCFFGFFFWFVIYAN